MNKGKMKLKRAIHISNLDKAIYITILILFITYLLIYNFDKKSTIILLNYAENNTKEITSSIINKAIHDLTEDSNYSDLIDVIKNENEEITNINFNELKVNKILYNVTDNILNNIYLFEKGETSEVNIKYYDSNDLIYYVPIGIIYDTPVLVGIGPKIPYKSTLVGNVNTEIETKIKEYGINNSLIELVLNVNINFQIILPFTSSKVSVNKSILLDSGIIQGKIPEYYGGLITNSSS
jgi:sporulation protein YunB